MAIPKARVQLLDPTTGEVVSEVDVITSAETTLYQNDNPIIASIGDIKEGMTFNEDTTVKDILDKILYPTILPSIHMMNVGSDILDDTVIYAEALQTVGGFVASLTVHTGSASQLEFTVNRTDLVTGEKNSISRSYNVIPGSLHTFHTDIAAIHDDTMISLSVSDGKELIESPSVTYKFIYPVYVGNATTLTGLLSDEDPDVLDSTKCTDYFNVLIRNKSPLISKRLCDVSNQKGFAVTDVLYQDQSLYPFVLYPNTWNKPVSITDPNGGDITGTYKYIATVMIRTDNNLAVDTQYTLYINTSAFLSNLSVLNEISYNFISDKGSLDHVEKGVPSMSGFDILNKIPCDLRTVVDKVDDLEKIKYPYEGLQTYVKETKSFFKYTSAKQWAPSNHDIHMINSAAGPAEDLGVWGDICINFTTGKFYEKSNVRWEELGQIIGGGDGSVGPQGEPGTAATIDIVSVTTVDSTESARVMNIGDKTHARLEMYIPRGLTGPQGGEGPTGPQGEPGATGSAATIRIGTVVPGKKFNVTNSGTTTDAVLDFTYPEALDLISDYESLYPTGAVFSTTNHSFDPNGTIPGIWDYIGSITTKDADGNDIVTDLYQNINEKE